MSSVVSQGEGAPSSVIGAENNTFTVSHHRSGSLDSAMASSKAKPSSSGLDSVGSRGKKRDKGKPMSGTSPVRLPALEGAGAEDANAVEPPDSTHDKEHSKQSHATHRPVASAPEVAGVLANVVSRVESSPARAATSAEASKHYSKPHSIIAEIGDIIKPMFVNNVASQTLAADSAHSEGHAKPVEVAKTLTSLEGSVDLWSRVGDALARGGAGRPSGADIQPAVDTSSARDSLGSAPMRRNPSIASISSVGSNSGARSIPASPRGASDKPTAASIAATAANLASQLREAQQHRLTLQQQLSALRAENARLKSSSGAITGESQDDTDQPVGQMRTTEVLKDQIGDLRKALNAATELKFAQDRTISQLQFAVDKSQQEKTSLETMVHRLEAALKSSQDRVMQLESEKSTLNGQAGEIADQNTQYARLVLELRTKISELQAHKDALILQQETRDGDHISQIKAMQAKIAVYEQQIAALRTYMQEAQQRLSTADATLSSVSLEWERKMSIAVEKTRAEVSAMWETTVGNLKAAAEEARLQSKSEYEEKLSTCKAEADARASSLSNEAKNWQNERDAVVKQLAAIQEESATLVARLNADIARLTADIHDSKAEASCTADKLVNSQRLVDKLKADCDKLVKRLEDTTSSLQRAKTELVSKESALLQAERALQTEKEKIDALIEALDIEKKKRTSVETDLRLALLRAQKLVPTAKSAEAVASITAGVSQSVPAQCSTTASGLTDRMERRALLKRKTKLANSGKWQSTLRSDPEPSEWVTSVSIGDTSKTIATAHIKTKALLMTTACMEEPRRMAAAISPSGSAEAARTIAKLQAAVKSSFNSVHALTEEKKAYLARIDDLNAQLAVLDGELVALRAEAPGLVDEREILYQTSARLQSEGVDLWKRLIGLIRVLGGRLQAVGEQTDVDPSSIDLPESFKIPLPVIRPRERLFAATLHKTSRRVDSAPTAITPSSVAQRSLSRSKKLRKSVNKMSPTGLQNSAGIITDSQRAMMEQYVGNMPASVQQRQVATVQEYTTDMMSSLGFNASTSTSPTYQSADPSPNFADHKEWRDSELSEEAFRRHLLAELQSAGLTPKEFEALSRGLDTSQLHAEEWQKAFEVAVPLSQDAGYGSDELMTAFHISHPQPLAGVTAGSQALIMVDSFHQPAAAVAPEAPKMLAEQMVVEDSSAHPNHDTVKTQAGPSPEAPTTNGQAQDAMQPVDSFAVAEEYGY